MKEIYGKQNQTAIELPKYEPRKFDEKDIRKEPQTISKHFQESQQDCKNNKTLTLDLNIFRF